MRAVVHDRHGPPDVLRLEEVPDPVPRAGEVLVRVHATTVNRTDCGMRSATPFFVRAVAGLRRPRWPILGNEFAGEVVALGPGVTRFQVGDRVFGCDQRTYAANAELKTVAEDDPIALAPEGTPDEEAAAVCDGFILAQTCLRASGAEGGQRVMVYGATGSIGTAAVQLARHLSADLTAVCDGTRVDLVASLGADRVIDYTREDIRAEGPVYDLVFDAVGKRSYRTCRPLLKPGGTYTTTDLGYLWHNPPLALASRVVGPHRVRLPIPRYRREEVLRVKDLIEAGEYRAVVDRTYPLEDIVEATRYVESGQKTGNVVITVGK
jgi:NADPH:quinone reductase-like Zn-dependent oxidoreductase